MLTSLKIQNLALVRDAQLHFGPGLTVLTGESGSGKSVVLDALALLAGDARPRLRPQEKKQSGLVEAEFLPPRNSDGSFKEARLSAALESHGLLGACQAADESLVIARRVESSGRSRCFVQGQVVSRAVLAAVGAELLELCGQSEAHRLRTPKAQLLALDHFAGLGDERRVLERLVRKLRSSELASSDAHDLAMEAERRRDFLEFQLNELRDCDVSLLHEQRARLEFLKTATSQRNASREALDCLKYGDHSVLSQLQWLACRLAAVEGRGNEPSSQLEDVIASAIDHLDEACALSEAASKEGDREMEELSGLSDQLKSLDILAEKHRIAAADLPARQVELEEELRLSTQLEEEYKDLKKIVQSLQAEAERRADILHDRRRKAAIRLEERLKKELVSVGLEGARLITHLSRGDLSSSGVTHLDIGFSANPGHPPAPLARVASGGELSRILLCFRLATDTSGALLAFDEIDAGAGGKTAEQIAQALLRAGERGQVLCVSHWAQVAGVAQHQFAVTKKTTSGTTLTTVRSVSGEARLAEISRMLGGTEKTARLHASMLVAKAPIPVEPAAA